MIIGKEEKEKEKTRRHPKEEGTLAAGDSDHITCLKGKKGALTGGGNGGKPAREKGGVCCLVGG